MNMYDVSISIAILSTALYHVTQKLTPRGVNPPISLLVTNALAIVLTAFLLYFMHARRSALAEARQFNWAKMVLPVSIVGPEVGVLLVYRSGWDIGPAAVLGNVVASLILVPVALMVLKDERNRINIAGPVTCLAGPVMLNWRR